VRLRSRQLHLRRNCDALVDDQLGIIVLDHRRRRRDLVEIELRRTSFICDDLADITTTTTAAGLLDAGRQREVVRVDQFHYVALDLNLVIYEEFCREKDTNDGKRMN